MDFLQSQTCQKKDKLTVFEIRVHLMLIAIEQ